MLTAPSNPFSLPSQDKNFRGFASEKIDALLEQLLQRRWQRVTSVHEDPLAVLFDAQSHQWTLGWALDCEDLFLLCRDMPAWQEKAQWSLYQNGQLIYQEVENASKTRTQLCQKLMDSESLPFITPQKLLETVMNYRPNPEQNQILAHKLLRTLQSRTDILPPLTESLLQALESNLGNVEWPMLEVLKLHRVTQKQPLLALFRFLVENELLENPQDKQRVDAAISRLQSDYEQLGRGISELFFPECERAWQAFRQVVTAGTWRVRLRLQPPGGVALVNRKVRVQGAQPQLQHA